MVLLPARPAEDLLALLALHGIGCTYETKNGAFTDSWPAQTENESSLLSESDLRDAGS